MDVGMFASCKRFLAARSCQDLTFPWGEKQYRTTCRVGHVFRTADLTNRRLMISTLTTNQENSLEIHRFLRAEEFYKKMLLFHSWGWWSKYLMWILDWESDWERLLLLSGLRTFLSDCTRAEEPTEELGLELCFCGRRCFWVVESLMWKVFPVSHRTTILLSLTTWNRRCHLVMI